MKVWIAVALYGEESRGRFSCVETPYVGVGTTEKQARKALFDKLKEDHDYLAEDASDADVEWFFSNEHESCSVYDPVEVEVGGCVVLSPDLE